MAISWTATNISYKLSTITSNRVFGMEFIKQQFKKHRIIIIAALAFTALGKIVSLFDIVIFKILIDKYALTIKGAVLIDLLWEITPYMIFLAVIVVAGKIFVVLQDYYLSLAIQKTSYDLYSQAINNAMIKSYEQSLSRHSAKILQDIISARDAWQTYLRNLVFNTYSNIIGLLFVVVFCFTINPLIGVAFAILSLILITATLKLSGPAVKLQMEIEKSNSELSAATMENLRNFELIHSLGLAEKNIADITDINEKVLDLYVKKFRLTRKIGLWLGGIISSARLIIIFGSLYFVYSGGLSIGGYLSLFIYTSLVFNPLNSVYGSLIKYRELEKSLAKVLPESLREPEYGKGIQLNEITELSVSGVSFAYDLNDFQLKNISLTASGGEIIALVGPSGSGKSTIIKLLLGILEPQSGKIRINQHDFKDISGTSFRSKIAIVSQQSRLLSGSVKENLTLMNPDATNEECLSALELVGLMPLINRSQDGLGMAVGEDGIKLSGGERQRLSLAGAFLRRPHLMILDEPTNHLDPILRQELIPIIKKMARSQPNLIVILVSHEPDIIRQTDRIYCLEDGEISASGGHIELASQTGEYAKMFK